MRAEGARGQNGAHHLGLRSLACRWSHGEKKGQVGQAREGGAPHAPAAARRVCLRGGVGGPGGAAHVDVSAEKCGYDVLSRTPVGPDGHVGPSRFIEVKGRATGATTVTVSRNEVLCALNNPDTFVLALVDVGPTATVTTYYREPFDQRPDSSACSCTYDVSKLMKNARKELVKESAR